MVNKWKRVDSALIENQAASLLTELLIYAEDLECNLAETVEADVCGVIYGTKYTHNYEERVKNVVSQLLEDSFASAREGTKPYYKQTIDDEESFSKKYLTPNSGGDNESYRVFVGAYIMGGAKMPEGITEIIKNMEYKDFLLTPYWQYIARYKKESGCGCALCGSQKNLVVHHPTYDFHGEEAENVYKLTVLCSSCHSKYHGKDEANNHTKKRSGLSLESLMAEETTSEKK